MPYIPENTIAKHSKQICPMYWMTAMRRIKIHSRAEMNSFPVWHFSIIRVEVVCYSLHFNTLSQINFLRRDNIYIFYKMIVSQLSPKSMLLEHMEQIRIHGSLNIFNSSLRPQHTLHIKGML